MAGVTGEKEEKKEKEEKNFLRAGGPIKGSTRGPRGPKNLVKICVSD